MTCNCVTEGLAIKYGYGCFQKLGKGAFLIKAGFNDYLNGEAVFQCVSGFF